MGNTITMNLKDLSDWIPWPFPLHVGNGATKTFIYDLSKMAIVGAAIGYSMLTVNADRIEHIDIQLRSQADTLIAINSKLGQIQLDEHDDKLAIGALNERFGTKFRDMERLIYESNKSWFDKNFGGYPDIMGGP